jgi:single-stranded DNA-specific DHH superfamily exonuclease
MQETAEELVNLFEQRRILENDARTLANKQNENQAAYARIEKALQEFVGESVPKRFVRVENVVVCIEKAKSTDIRALE